MIDICKEDMDFLNDIKAALAVDSQCEVFLKYKDIHILLEPQGSSINVYVNGKVVGKYLSFDEMISNLSFENKLFIELISEIEYE